jgi:GNAT superfamily N-acetyltransferase
VTPLNYVVRNVREADIAIAVALLSQFFTEEGFSGTSEAIAANTRRLWADPYHWVALAWLDGTAIGVVTVTTMLYVDWGRLGEIGDLYVLPEVRRRGVAAALIDAATAKCRELGCSAVSVTITPEGEARHGLSSFYRRLGFVGSDRMIVTHVLRPAS